MNVIAAIVVLLLILSVCEYIERRPRRVYLRRLEPLDLSRAAARGQLHLNDHRPGGDATDSTDVCEAPTPHKERT